MRIKCFVRRISYVVVVLFLAACGNQVYLGPITMPEPPVRIGTLEEQFDQRRDANGGLMSITSVIPYPTTFPTESLSFSSKERFSISYEIRIAVESPNSSLDSLNDFPGEKSNIHLISGNEGVTVEVTLTLEYTDLEGVFYKLYSMGVVEEYRVTIWDMGSVDVTDEAFWQARWEEDNTIAITFVEFRD